MDNTAENPYKAPEAEVVSDSGTGSLSDIFPRFSAWGVFGLSIITWVSTFPIGFILALSRSQAMLATPHHRAC